MSSLRLSSPTTARATEAGIIGHEPTADLIAEELQAEREVRRSFEQRALSLFASAGVIASLSGIAARGFDFPVATRVLLGLALAALASGALVGLWVAYPIILPEVIEPSGLLKVLESELSAEDQLLRASRARITIAERARKTNAEKAERLKLGMRFTGAGVVLLLAAIIVALWSGPKETSTATTSPVATPTAVAAAP